MRHALALDLQRRWGCPGGGHARAERLDPDLEEEAVYAAETMGILVRGEDPGTPAPPLPPALRCCPLAAQLTAGPWVREVLRAASMMREFKGGLTFRDVVGRDPDAWDVRALDALLRAQVDVLESDAAIEAEERKAQGKR